MCSVVLMDSSANRWALSFVLMDDENPSAQECLEINKSWPAIVELDEKQSEKELLQQGFDGEKTPKKGSNDGGCKGYSRVLNGLCRIFFLPKCKMRVRVYFLFGRLQN